MKKLLFAIMAIVLCVGLIGGAFAYFTDTLSSSGNNFTAGYTELLMSNGGDYTHTNALVIGSGTKMSPGGPAVGTFNVGFENGGNISGEVTGTMTYSQSIVIADQTVNFTPPEYTGTVSADAFAQKLIVASAFTDGSGSTNVAPFWAAQIADTYAGGSWAVAIANNWIVADSTPGLYYAYLPTVYGMQYITLHFWDNYTNKIDQPLAPGEKHWVNGTLKLSSAATNNWENMGINITVAGTLTSN
jgi:predicted ribosomally synthesized peptide with SipW-like signal peptide